MPRKSSSHTDWCKQRWTSTMVRRLAQKEHSADSLSACISAVIKFGVRAGEVPFANVGELRSTGWSRRLHQMPATSLTAMTSWRKSLRRKRTFKPRWRRTLPCLKQQLRSPSYCTVRFAGLQAVPGSLSAQQLKMDVLRVDERNIFCCHSLDDIMRATDVVFGGKRAFCERFLRWSRRFYWLNHRHPSFVMSCSFTNRGSSACRRPVVVYGRPLVPKTGSSMDGPWSSADGPWSSADGPWSSADGPWSSADGPWSSTDGPWPSTDGPTGARTWLLFVVQPRCKYRVVVLPVVVQRQVLPCGSPWRFHSRRSWTTSGHDLDCADARGDSTSAHCPDCAEARGDSTVAVLGHARCCSTTDGHGPDRAGALEDSHLQILDMVLSYPLLCNNRCPESWGDCTVAVLGWDC